MLEFIGSVVWPSCGRLKQCNNDLNSEGSSEYPSVNNAGHLRWLLTLPQPLVNGGASEVDVNDIMFGFGFHMKANNLNIHVREGFDGCGKEDWKMHSQQSFFSQGEIFSQSPVPVTGIKYCKAAFELKSLVLKICSYSVTQPSYRNTSFYHRENLPFSTSLPRRHSRQHKYNDRMNEWPTKKTLFEGSKGLHTVQC